MNKKLIIFDFDGVLVNTADIGYLLHLEANPTLSRDYFAQFSVGNFIENIEKAIRDDGYKVQENWDQQYLSKLLELEPHDVIAALVRDLAMKYTLVVVSSSNVAPIETFLLKEHIRDCFAEILGADVHPSKVVKIARVLEMYKCAPTEAIFITDTLGDVREGNECQVASIGVTWGTHDRETIEKGNPFSVVDSVPELESEIARFFEVQETVG